MQLSWCSVSCVQPFRFPLEWPIMHRYEHSTLDIYKEFGMIGIRNCVVQKHKMFTVLRSPVNKFLSALLYYGRVATVLVHILACSHYRCRCTHMPVGGSVSRDTNIKITASTSRQPSVSCQSIHKTSMIRVRTFRLLINSIAGNDP